MSRSYRRPYASSCGGGISAKHDKVLAHRGLRRVHNHFVRQALHDLDVDLDLPHFRSCPNNNVYDWVRDGGKRLQVPDARSWSQHMLAVQGFGSPWSREHYLEWPPGWYIELRRK